MAYDPSIFEQQRRNLELGFSQNAALNAYRRYIAENAGQRAITTGQESAFGFGGQGGASYLGQVPKLTASYGKRGLQGMGTKSGIYNKALGQYTSDRAKNLGYAQSDLANILRGYDLSQTQGLERYQEGLKDIEAEKARQIAADAQALLGLRQDDMAVVQYGSAPPGARAGAKAAGIGAPGSTNYNPSAAVVETEDVDIAAAVAAALGEVDFGDTGFGDMGTGSGSGNSGPPKSYYDAMGDARTSAAQTASDTLLFNMGKYQDQQALDAAALKRKYTGAAAQKTALESMLTGGVINPDLLQTIDDQKTDREDYLNTQYKNLSGQLSNQYYGEGGSVANPTALSSLGLTNTGFKALQTYLENAGTSPYADPANRATAGTVSNDLAQYMQAQGVDQSRANPGLMAANTALQGGAANYNNLLTTLAATSASAQKSRLAEQQMAQTLAQARLAAQQAQQQGNLTNAQLQGLQTIQDQYTSAKAKLQQDAIARDQALEQAIAELVGTGYTEVQKTDEEVVADKAAADKAAADKVIADKATLTASRSGAVNILANQIAAAKGKNAPALQARANAFIAANPKATPAQVKEEFPDLRAVAVKAAAAKKKK